MNYEIKQPVNHRIYLSVKHSNRIHKKPSGTRERQAEGGGVGRDVIRGGKWDGLEEEGEGKDGR